MNRQEQIRRIAHFEALFDEVSCKVNLLYSEKTAWESLKPAVDELTAYYESDDWKQDFAADEAGLLPPDLKRGVLSEDGVYDLLDKLRGLLPDKPVFRPLGRIKQQLDDETCIDLLKSAKRGVLSVIGEYFTSPSSRPEICALMPSI